MELGTIKSAISQWFPPLIGFAGGYFVGPMIISQLSSLITTNAGAWITAEMAKWILCGIFVAIGIGAMFHGSWIAKGIGGGLVGVGVRALF